MHTIDLTTVGVFVRSSVYLWSSQNAAFDLDWH